MIKYKDLTIGFTFILFGKEVIIVSDYEKFDANMKNVQIALTERPNVSAGVYSKQEILNYLNTNNYDTEN